MRTRSHIYLFIILVPDTVSCVVTVSHSTHGRFTLQEQFLDKNNDALHSNLVFLVAESTNGLVKHMYSGSSDTPAKSGTGKLNFVSVGSKFRSQLQLLLEKLRSTVSSIHRLNT